MSMPHQESGSESGPEVATQRGCREFREQVFPAELEEIRRRREAASDARPEMEGNGVSVDQDLAGLAISGGGIRSASFSLGVIQEFIRSGFFGKFDYLSTVSGGGYTGSCLSSLMARDCGAERLLVDRTPDGEPPAINHIRNGSNYLMQDGLHNLMRLPALLLEGVIHSLVTFLPLVVLLVFVTELYFELTDTYLPEYNRHHLILLLTVPFLCSVLVRAVRSRSPSWDKRDRRDSRLGVWLLLAIVGVAGCPILLALDAVVDNDLEGVLEMVTGFCSSQFEAGWRAPGVWIVSTVVALIVAGFIRLRSHMFVVAIGVLGPLWMVGLYVLACISVINSPYVQKDEFVWRPAERMLHHLHEVAERRADESPEEARERVIRVVAERILRAKHIDIGHYDTNRGTFTTNHVFLVHTNKDAIPAWERYLTSTAHPELHINFSATWWDTNSVGGQWALSGDREIGRAEVEELAMLHGSSDWWFYGLGLVVYLFQYLVNVNQISMHPFYRDRLSRTFLMRTDPHGGGGLQSADGLRLSQLREKGSRAPYHLINTALNLQGSRDSQLRERKSVPFLLSKHFCGSHYTGYMPTRAAEDIDRAFNLGTAMAISAAAASPNMGAISMKPLTFLMALLNIRLNYWFPNPAYRWRHLEKSPGTWTANPSAGTGTATVGRRRRRTPWQTLRWRPDSWYILHEAFGTADASRPFVNCSDGGHVENLAVYELLRRKCRTIVCIDGEADPRFHFHGLITLQRFARIDFGARIEIDLGPIRPNAAGISEKRHAIGNIRYDDGAVGTFIYLKLACCGDEPEYVRFYRHQFPEFPHEGTGNQFYGETKMEAYRALGALAARDLAAELEAKPT